MQRLVGTHTHIRVKICNLPSACLCTRTTQYDTFNNIQYFVRMIRTSNCIICFVCAFKNLYFQILNTIHMVLPLLQSTTHHQPNEIQNEFNFNTLSKLAARMTNWDGMGSGVSSASFENITHQHERNIQIAATLLLNQNTT